MKVCSACKTEEIKEVEIATSGAFVVTELKKGISILPDKSKIGKHINYKLYTNS